MINSLASNKKNVIFIVLLYQLTGYNQFWDTNNQVSGIFFTY